MVRVQQMLRRSIVAASVAGFVACSTPGPAPPPTPLAGERETYVIGLTDVLRIDVWKNPEVSVIVPVRNDGKISVPLLDDVQAEGLTPEELKEVITQELSEYITSPDVTVVVNQANSQTVSIIGAVGRSSQIALQREMRVLDAIATAGGFSAFARKNDVRILRRTPDGIVEYHFSYGAFLSGKAAESNIVLRPGDTIVVPD